jgi:DNA polymerase alpha subunit A
MIHTATTDLAQTKALAANAKKEINKLFKLLEVELDGVFKPMLLLQKKKYAAIKLEEKGGGKIVSHVEKKGLDLVRRDWCPLSKEMGDFGRRGGVRILRKGNMCE